MRVDIITVLPELLDGPFSASILKRAQEKGLAEIHVHNLRDYSTHRQKSVDDYAFGGGAGMVMTLEPIDNCISALKGEELTQAMSNSFSLKGNLMILCGHYKGIDERAREAFITKEISIGSYVLSGGELAAAVLTDSIIRLLPGVLNDETSALSDSYQDNLLAPPVYTRPAEYKGMQVPDILLSGDLKKIEIWRHEKSLERTKIRRPDLYKKYSE
jgi:tRNA (guanine37-N1)-methyltransferase